VVAHIKKDASLAHYGKHSVVFFIYPTTLFCSLVPCISFGES